MHIRLPLTRRKRPTLSSRRCPPEGKLTRSAFGPSTARPLRSRMTFSRSRGRPEALLRSLIMQDVAGGLLQGRAGMVAAAACLLTRHTSRVDARWRRRPSHHTGWITTWTTAETLRRPGGRLATLTCLPLSRVRPRWRCPTLRAKHCPVAVRRSRCRGEVVPGDAPRRRLATTSFPASVYNSIREVSSPWWHAT